MAEEYAVFARISPQQKYEIIEVLEKKYSVGFLGEGINDAPALKIANVALVVTGAADIAKESADIVLLERSLSVIVDGIRQGRMVFANTNKYITATLSANFGNFFAVAMASLITTQLPMLPLQLLLVNLFTDFPMIAVSTDTVDSTQTQSPQRYNLRDFAQIALLLGAVSTVFDFVFFGTFLHFGIPTLQTAWFMGSVLTELIFIFSIRTHGVFWKGKWPSPALLALTLGTCVMAVLLPFTSLGHSIFSFINLKPPHLLMVSLIVVAYFVSTEGVKLLYFRQKKA